MEHLKSSNKPLKIIFVSSYWRKSDGGGILVYLENLIFHISKTFIVKVISRKGISQSANEKIVEGNRLTFIYKCFLLCIKERPTIIHTQSDWYCLLPAVLYKFFFNTKIVHSIHSVPEKKIFFLTRIIFYTLLKKCDRVHFVSKFLRSYYLKEEDIRLKHTIIIYPGCNHIRETYTESEKSLFRSQYNIPPHTKIILAQGLTAHNLKHDGAKILIDVFAQLSAEFPDYILLLTKGGKYLTSLKNRSIELGIGEKVVFTGNLGEPVIANAVADVYAHITMGEGGISIALLEAMAIGNPIIATNVGGIPELIANSEIAIIVTPTFNAVYNGLKILCIDRLLCNSMGKSAQQFAKSNFTWEDTSEKFEVLYKSILK